MRKAFTLVEVLIAMALSSLIFMMVSSLLVTMLASNTKSRRQEVFEQVKNDLFVELGNVIRWGRSVTYSPAGGGEKWLVADGVTYKLEGEKITKNGEPLTPGSVIVRDFRITPYANVNTYVSLEVEVELEDRNFSLTRDSLRFVASQRKTEVEESQ